MSLNRQQLAALKAIQCLRRLEMTELEELRRCRKKPRYWVNPFLAKRENYDIEQHLLKDVLWEDGEDYKNFCRMTIHKFEEILQLVQSGITKKDTAMRYAISARVRLAISLRYIASGDSYRSLEFLTRVSRKTISEFVPQVLLEIYNSLQPTYMKLPSTQIEWLEIAEDFNNIWDFPHTLGALDGKHVRIKAPANSGSEFYNYKGFFSTVLLAVVNAHSKFIYINVGANGRASDNVVFKNSSLYKMLLSGKLNIPPPMELKGQQHTVPYFLIGDDIFGLGKHLMKAYSRNLNLTTQQEIFNYRLSRARLQNTKK